MPTLQLVHSHVRAELDGARLTPFTVESFSGANDDLQAFIEETWSKAYSGRMMFPVWSKEYFDWQLSAPNDQPNRRLAVYDAGRLVAVLLGTSTNFRMPGGSLPGAHWSWLTVAESHRGMGLASLLDAARVKLERSADAGLVVSYRFSGSKYSLAERPSNRFPLKKFLRRTGFWARPLDGNKLQRWNLNRAEGWLARAVHPFLPTPRWAAKHDIRLFEHEDLADCQRLTTQQFQNCCLAVQWDTAALEHQLTGSSISQTVVAEHRGRVQGFVNFHILPFQAATRELVAVVDLICVNQLPTKSQVALLRSALSVMQEQGAILALKVRSGDVSAPLMLRTNFTPRLPDSHLVLQWTKQVQDIPKHQPLHCLWR